MPEVVIAIINVFLALLSVVRAARRARPDPLEESTAAHHAAITAADAARASARRALTAELAEFDAEARRILDVLDAPCVCSQVLTHEWDEHTQAHRQRWTVPVHFTACLKHWPATTGAPPRTADQQQRQSGPMLTPAARVNAERARYAAEAWARRATGAHPLRWEDYAAIRYPTAELDATLDRLAEIQAETRRARGSTPTTYGVPEDCTCVPDHARAALASTHVLHRVGCATNRGPHAAEWRPVRDNG